jgi:hypothetical protein
VGVRVAAHVDEKGRVVDGRARLLVHPQLLGQPQRDQALAEDVLHRLAEAEIDPEGEGRYELSESDVGAIVIATHMAKPKAVRP